MNLFLLQCIVEGRILKMNGFQLGEIKSNEKNKAAYRKFAQKHDFQVEDLQC